MTASAASFVCAPRCLHVQLCPGPPPPDLPRLPTWDPQKRGTAVPGWMFFGTGAILLIYSPKRGTAVPVAWAAGAGPGGGSRVETSSGRQWTLRAPMTWCEKASACAVAGNE